MEQRCYLWNVWLAWVGMPLLAAVVWWRLGLAAGLFVLAVGAIAQVLYVRSFPKLSRFVGYGSIEDVPAADAVAAIPPATVTLYTANLCPFCPIVRQRLVQLQRRMPFELREIDVTFRPDLVRAKALRSVPAIEAGGRVLSGNATTQQLVAFLAGSVVPA